jgi:hypothetical protein
MHTQTPLQTLHTLHQELCMLLRKGEWLWYGMADDYQSKYAFTQDYDKSFKRMYHEKGRACRQLAQDLEQVALPASLSEIAAFVDTVNSHLTGCPQHWKMREPIQSIVTRMEALAVSSPAS